MSWQAQHREGGGSDLLLHCNFAVSTVAFQETDSPKLAVLPFAPPAQDELMHYARCRGDWEGLLEYLLQRQEVRGMVYGRVAVHPKQPARRPQLASGWLHRKERQENFCPRN